MSEQKTDSPAADEGKTCACGASCNCKCKWFVLLLLIVVGGGWAGYWALFTRVYNQEACQQAMQAIKADEAVQKALGTPIETVKWPSREVAPNARVDEREADILWHVEGPKGRAQAHVSARRSAGKWDIIILEITLPGGKKMAVRQAGESANDAQLYVPPKAGAKKTETNTPAPNINLPVPPDGAPAGGK